MKVIVLNGSPRKNNNTAKMLKSAKEGAESKGYEVEYYDLYDLNFTGCRSCLACKLKDGRRNHCFWKDDLSPIIDKIFESDALIIGSPIYQGHITSQIQALMQFRNICEANAQKLLLYQNLCCSEHCNQNYDEM